MYRILWSEKFREWGLIAKTSNYDCDLQGIGDNTDTNDCISANQAAKTAPVITNSRVGSE